MIKENVLRKNLLNNEIDIGIVDSIFEGENLKGNIINSHPYIELKTTDQEYIDYYAKKDLIVYKITKLKELDLKYDLLQTFILKNSVEIVLPCNARDSYGRNLVDVLSDLFSQAQSCYNIGFRNMYDILGNEYQIESVNLFLLDYIMYIVRKCFDNNKLTYQKIYAKIKNATLKSTVDSEVSEFNNYPKKPYNQNIFYGDIATLEAFFDRNSFITNVVINLDELVEKIKSSSATELLTVYAKSNQEAVDVFNNWYSSIQSKKEGGKYKLFIKL
jgi:hypothetical protein